MSLSAVGSPRVAVAAQVPGATGEAVLQLQSRLQAVGLLTPEGCAAELAALHAYAVTGIERKEDGKRYVQFYNPGGGDGIYTDGTLELDMDEFVENFVVVDWVE
jgi:hypothetical protein